jgi:hypothetical protein
MLGEIVLFDQQHRESTACGIPRDPRPVNAAANDEKINRVLWTGSKHDQAGLHTNRYNAP